MNLTHHQIRILKYISEPKSAKQVCDKFHTDFANLAANLVYDGVLLFAYEHEPVYDDTLIWANNIAIAEIEKRNSDAMRFLIPVAISVLLFIVSFIALFK